MADEKNFRVTTVGQVRRERAARGETPVRPALNPANVPETLRDLLPYAQQWGISDDTWREELLTSAPKEQLLEVLRVVSAHSQLLLDWLAGPESHSPRPSPEYIAFSALQMLADNVQSSLRD